MTEIGTQLTPERVNQLVGSDAPPPPPEKIVAPTDAADVDRIELESAQTALQTETTGLPPPIVPPAGSDAPPAPSATPAPGEKTPAEIANALPTPPAAPGPSPTAPAKPPMVTVPKARLDEVLKQRDTANSRAAFLEGRLSAVDPEFKPGATVDTPPPPVDPRAKIQTRLTSIGTEKIELAKQYDAGELKTHEWQQRVNELDDESRRLTVEEIRLETAPRNAAGDDTYLDTLTSQLETQHPYVSAIPADDPRWDFLTNEALRNLQGRGVKLTQDGHGTFTLRKEIAELADKYGPLWIGPLAKPGADGRPPANPTAGQRQDKLNLAAAHPPNINDIARQPGTDLANLTEAQIAGMSDEEITALPEQTRRKLLPAPT